MEARVAQCADLDPRIRRTRGLLQGALARLLTEKDFEKISVQDIAEAATLNRATFYDHYTDKFALLDALVETRFRDLIRERRLCFAGCEGAVRAIFTGICEYLSAAPSAARACAEKTRETAIVAVIEEMVLEGLANHAASGEISQGMIASTIAWAIYGAARHWLKNPGQMSMEEAAAATEQLTVLMIPA